MMSVAQRQPLEVHDENSQKVLPNQDVNSTIQMSQACPFCQLIIADVSALQKHISEHLSKVTKKKKPNKHIRRRALSHDCELCGTTHRNLQVYAQHMKRMHLIDLPRCHICSKLYPNNKELLKHMNQHDASIRMTCELCQVKFENASELTKHLIEHLGTRSNKCPVCFNVYSSNSTVKKHMKIHSGERPFKCDICVMYFFQEWDVARHVLTKAHMSKKTELLKRGKPAIEPQVSPQLMVTARHSYFRMISKPANDKAKQLKFKAVHQPCTAMQNSPHHKQYGPSGGKRRHFRKKVREGPSFFGKASRDIVIKERVQRRNRKRVNYSQLDKDSSEEDNIPRRFSTQHYQAPPSPPCDRVEIEMDVDISPAGVLQSYEQPTVITPMSYRMLQTNTFPAKPLQQETGPRYMSVSVDSDVEEGQTSATVELVQNGPKKNVFSRKSFNKSILKTNLSQTALMPTVRNILSPANPSLYGSSDEGKGTHVPKIESSVPVVKGLQNPIDQGVITPQKLIANTCNATPVSATGLGSFNMDQKCFVTPPPRNALPQKANIASAAEHSRITRPPVYMVIKTSIPIPSTEVKVEKKTLDTQTLIRRAGKAAEVEKSLENGQDISDAIIIDSESDEDDEVTTKGHKVTGQSNFVDSPLKIKEEPEISDVSENGQIQGVICQVVNDSHLAKNDPAMHSKTENFEVAKKIAAIAHADDKTTKVKQPFLDKTLKPKQAPTTRYEPVEILSDDDDLPVPDLKKQSNQVSCSAPDVQYSTLVEIDSALDTANTRVPKILEPSTIVTIDSDSEDDTELTINIKIKTEMSEDSKVGIIPAPVSGESEDTRSADEGQDGKQSSVGPFASHTPEKEKCDITPLFPDITSVPSTSSHTYLCIECGMDFPTQDMLDQHVPLHDEEDDPTALTIVQNDGSVTYMCFSCSSILHSKELLKKHKKVCSKMS